MFPKDLAAILFDAGGTLVRIDYAFVVGVAAEFGFSLSSDGLLHAEAAARRSLDARAAALDLPKDTDSARVPGYFESLLRAAGLASSGLNAVLGAMQAAHRESNLWRVPMAGAQQTLRSLRQRGLRAAVVSNSDGTVRGVLERAGLVDEVEFVMDSHEEGVEKPDPEIFRRALARLGLPAERVAYIGDIYSIDVVGARRLGLHPVLVDPTGGYEGVDCPTVAGLTELLDRLT